MSDFFEVLKEWNNGIMRGAQARLAKELGVSKTTVLRWGRNDLLPSEVQIKKMAKILKKGENEIRKIFSSNNGMYQYATNIRNNKGGINQIIQREGMNYELLKKDVELLKKDIEVINLKLDLLSKK